MAVAEVGGLPVGTTVGLERLPEVEGRTSRTSGAQAPGELGRVLVVAEEELALPELRGL